MSLKQKSTGDVTVENDAQMQTRRIWKNVIILTVVFLLNSSSFNGLFAIQSSLHREEGMGTTGISVLYITSTVTCLFLAPLFGRLLGQKWTICTALVSSFIWIIANGIGTWGSIVTGSIINGLFTGPMWAAHGSYLTEMAKIYADINCGATAEQVSTLFFGIFYIQYGLSGFIGDAIASSVLIKSPSENYTYPSEEDIQETCGMNDCPWVEHNITTFDPPSNNTVWTLVGIYLTLSLSAVLLSVFGIDTLNKLKGQSSHHTDGLNIKEVCKAVLSCFRLIKHHRLWLILVMDAYFPIAVAFRVADFNASWVTCALGIWMVGLVNLPGHLIKALICPATGYTTKKYGPIIPIVFSIIGWAILILILQFWTTSGEDVWMYFLLSVIYALHFAPFDTLAIAIHGISFLDDTTEIYTWNNVFWSCFSAISYGYSYHLCSDTKFYIVMGMFVISCTFYFILEWDLHRNKPKSTVSENNLDSNEKNAWEKTEDEYVTVYDNHSFTTKF